MSDLFDLLIGPSILIAAFALIFGLLAFAELWEGKRDDEDKKGKK